MTPTHVPALLCVGFLLLGLFFVGSGIRTLAAQSRRSRTWVRMPGRVVASRLDGDLTRSQVAFRLQERTVLFWNRYTSTTVRDPVGRDVQVLVNPADPHDAVVESGLVGGSLVGVLFVVLGSVFALAGALVGGFLLFW